MRDKLKSFNERAAVFGTKVFSSMITFWVFLFWGGLALVPGLPPAFQNIVLLVSSALIQLAALPLIAVGAAVLNRASERRAKEDHRMLKAEFACQNAELARLQGIDVRLDAIEIRQLKEIRAMLAEVLDLLKKQGADESAPVLPDGR